MVTDALSWEGAWPRLSTSLREPDGSIRAHRTEELPAPTTCLVSLSATASYLPSLSGLPGRRSLIMANVNRLSHQVLALIRLPFQYARGHALIEAFRLLP